MKWGGQFQTTDIEARAVVSGQVWGDFSGDVPTDMESPVKAALMRAAQDVLVGSDLHQLLSRPDLLANAINNQCAPQLQALGVVGKIQMAEARIDPSATLTAPQTNGASEVSGIAKAMLGGEGLAKAASFSSAKLITAVVFVIIVAVGGGIAYKALKGKFIGGGVLAGEKNTASYNQFGIDKTKASADEVFSAADKLASRKVGKERRFGKWSWRALDIRGMGPDGFIDFSSGGRAVFTYMVIGRVTALSKRKRDGSIKKIQFGKMKIKHGKRLTPNKRWKGITASPRPTCTPCKLAKALKTDGLTTGKTVRISFDPMFAFGPGAPKEVSWRVRSNDPPIDAHYSMSTCKLTRDRNAK